MWQRMKDLVWENLIDAYKMFLEICYEKRNKQMIVMSVFYIYSESSIKTFLINKYHKKSGHF